MSLTSGDLVDVVFFGTGTGFGTTSVSLTPSGEVIDTVYLEDGGTYSGTVSVLLAGGAAEVISVYGGGYVEDGKMTVGFSSGLYS
jgi:hypothetical protein